MAGFYTLIVTHTLAVAHGQRPSPRESRRRYASEAATLDAAVVVLDEEDRRRRDPSSKLPPLTDLVIERPDGSRMSYAVVRRRAEEQRG